jgi:NADH-quinone oxidoreductase subunit N
MFADAAATMTPEIQRALADAVWTLKPEMILGLFACILFLGGTMTARRGLWGFVALIGLLVALWASFDAPRTVEVGVFVVPIRIDSLAVFTRILAILSGIVLLLLAWDELPEKQTADHHACLLVLIAGLSMVGSANDLVTLFLALELISIPTYIILYLPRHDDKAQEAALKYFLLSIFSSGILLFGFSYLYGLVGSTNLSVILDTLNASRPESPTIAVIALVTIVCGLGFRLTAVPFHFYAPDVYQGTANVSAALLSYVPKVAGVIALLRLLGYVTTGDGHAGPLIGTSLSDQVPLVFWILAVLTMFIGNLLALRQEHVRRILAYSSIANAGYMLVALSSAPYLRHGGGTGPDGVEAVVYYLVAYGAMTVGVFAILAYLDSDERRIDTLDDLAGLSREHPVLSIVLAIFLFSLIGIPLTAGFTGKFFVFRAAYHVAGPLVVIALICSAIAAFYYLRIIVLMFFAEPPENGPTIAIPGWSTSIALTFGVVATIFLGVFPQPILDLATKAAHLTG